MVGRRGHSREDPIHAQQHIPVHLGLPKASLTLQEVFKYRHHPRPHTHLHHHLRLTPFSLTTCPLYLLASLQPPHWGGLSRGLGSHRAKSRRSLTRTNFPPLTRVERREPQNTQDTGFSREHANGAPVYSAKVNPVINISVV